MSLDLEKHEVEIKLKEYEQSMITYRYLGDINVKYVMFFLIVTSFVLKIFVDNIVLWFPLAFFIGIVGLYVTISIFLVMERMQSLSDRINKLSSELQMEEQTFAPFLKFLKITSITILLATFVVCAGMYCHKNTSAEHSIDKAKPAISVMSQGKSNIEAINKKS